MNSCAKCYITHKKVPIIDGAFVAKQGDGSWYFTSIDHADSISDYGFACARVLKTPEATISWIAHLATKEWFSPEKFTKFMHTLAHEGGFTQDF